MKEIVFIRQSSNNMGGVQWQIVNLAGNLYSRGCFKPVLITDNLNSKFAKKFIENDFAVLVVKMDGSYFTVAKNILQAIKGRDVAVIQSHLLRESFITRLVRRKRHNVKHVFRAQVYPSGLTNSACKKKFIHILDRLSSKWVDYYIANGKYLGDEIMNLSKVNSKKISVVLNGKDSAGIPDDLTNGLQESLSKKIAMIANFTTGKGHDCLVRALAILKDKNMIINARLIGASNSKDMKYESDLKKLAADLNVDNQLEFYGYAKDIQAALRGISVVVLPSDSEGVPNCVLEAMSIKKLVVASDTGGVSEIIEYGKNGFLHEPKYPYGLAKILEDVFTKTACELQSIRQAGFDTWKNKFITERMVDEMVDIYKTMGLL